MDVAKRTFMKRDENGNPVEAVSVPMSPFELQAWLAENAPGDPFLKQFHAPPPPAQPEAPPRVYQLKRPTFDAQGNMVHEGHSRYYRFLSSARTYAAADCVGCSGFCRSPPEVVNIGDPDYLLCGPCFRNLYFSGLAEPERPNLHAHEGSDVHETEPTAIVKTYDA